jgi:hypothetical protein
MTGILATWLGCASPAKTQAEEKPRWNWTSADAPCANYDDLLKPGLGDIGVRFDAAEPQKESIVKCSEIFVIGERPARKAAPVVICRGNCREAEGNPAAMQDEICGSPS